MNTGLQLRNYETYKVIKKPLTQEQKEVLKLLIKPLINLEGYSSGKVPFEISNKVILTEAEGYGRDTNEVDFWNRKKTS